MSSLYADHGSAPVTLTQREQAIVLQGAHHAQKLPFTKEVQKVLRELLKQGESCPAVDLLYLHPQTAAASMALIGTMMGKLRKPLPRAKTGATPTSKEKAEDARIELEENTRSFFLSHLCKSGKPEAFLTCCKLLRQDGASTFQLDAIASIVDLVLKHKPAFVRGCFATTGGDVSRYSYAALRALWFASLAPLVIEHLELGAGGPLSTEAMKAIVGSSEVGVGTLPRAATISKVMTNWRVDNSVEGSEKSGGL